MREDERDQLFGLSLRELVHTFKWQTLVLLKAMLLQPKVRCVLHIGVHNALMFVDAVLRVPLRTSV